MSAAGGKAGVAVGQSTKGAKHGKGAADDFDGGCLEQRCRGVTCTSQDSDCGRAICRPPSRTRFTGRAAGATSRDFVEGENILDRFAIRLFDVDEVQQVNCCEPLNLVTRWFHEVEARDKYAPLCRSDYAWQVDIMGGVEGTKHAIHSKGMLVCKFGF